MPRKFSTINLSNKNMEVPNRSLVKMTFSILWFPKGLDIIRCETQYLWVFPLNPLNTLPHYHLDYHSGPH